MSSLEVSWLPQACDFQVLKSISGLFCSLHLPLPFSNARCEDNKIKFHPLQCGPVFWPLFDNDWAMCSMKPIPVSEGMKVKSHSLSKESVNFLKEPLE